MPRYHLLYTDGEVNELGEHRAYRLENAAMSPLLHQQGNEEAYLWARYQLAVTRQRDSERTSSSPYAQWHTNSPLVNFETYLNNNENIVDEDLVAWVTLSDHVIPSLEDLPNSATVGREMSFYLSPFNYFPESPTMSSRDAVFLGLADPQDPARGLRYFPQGGPTEEAPPPACQLDFVNASVPWIERPDSLVEATVHDGVF
ncbi:putative amine oxidase [copper-containing] [Aplysia californica]|uniref:Amine oxidase n=1 Tax=Aplysia californica TaxID=6500 RepID=A0ABM1A2Q5_APLCA|nr:putative amine oxidase [copper-containing] [Aplysia californica]